MIDAGLPSLLVLSCWAAACLATISGERLALPADARRAAAAAGRRSRVRDIVLRCLLVGLVFSFFFSFSWRPIYSAGAAISFFLIFTAISRGKYGFVREPLVFSDVAQLPSLLLHKEIFYAGFVNGLFWVAAFAYVFGASALFFVFEPHLLPLQGARLAVPLAIAVALAPWLILLWPAARRAAASLAAQALDGFDPVANTLRFGTFGAMALEFLVWLDGPRAEPSPASVEEAGGTVRRFLDAWGNERPPVVVVWQSESFLDMRRLGVSGFRLPAIDELRARALHTGLIGSIFEGGYTVRTEFSVISGLSPAALGVDASHPYINAAAYSGVAWPTLLRRAGWTTHFLHPYDRRFFNRSRAVPALGFDDVSMIDAFDHDPARDGPYVPDARLGERVLELCREPAGNGSFIFVASMENHGPWEPGRAETLTDPVAIYLRILERTDAALGRLVSGLDALDRPVWLLFYGDHAPLLKSFAFPFPDPRTDYLMVASGTARRRQAQAGERLDLEPWNLVRTMLQAASQHPGSAGS